MVECLSSKQKALSSKPIYCQNDNNDDNTNTQATKRSRIGTIQKHNAKI
jgi:hypothetical protein